MILPTGTVTFLFSDIEGSTPLWEQHPEQMAEALEIHNNALRQAIEKNGGVVFKIVGDSFQAAFATALQALRAAIDGQKAIMEASWNDLGPLRVRMGLHTGEAQLDPGGDEYAVSHTKNRVARIMSAAHGGQILLSQETADLVQRMLPGGVTLKNLGEHRLKGMQWLERLYQVTSQNLPHDFPPLSSQISRLNNFPIQRTPLIGRSEEVRQVCELLKQWDLVTLTGSGGVGKTRLLLKVSEEIFGQFSDGACWVELGSVTDLALVPMVVATAIGLREETGFSFLDILKTFLKEKQILLVLDNCEHLLPACAHLVDTLLRSCLKIKFLTSSREALGVEGEAPFRVPSLAFPDPHTQLAWQSLQNYESVLLFCERAKVVSPGFQISELNAPAVSAICQRLDGIPLAIELAATRLNLLTVEQLSARLQDAFRLLTRGSRTALPRQQTLRATIDWSYQLLSEAERILLRRLSVFVGSFLLEAVEVICVGNGVDSNEIMDLLGELVNKSMVHQVPHTHQQQISFSFPPENRYRLLETVSQYAREKLFEAGEAQSFRDRHLDYYLRRTERAEIELRSHQRLEATRFLIAELENLRTAVDWAYNGREGYLAGLRIATAIGRRFMQTMGWYSETREWLLNGLQPRIGIDIPPLLHARALNVLGWFGLNFSDDHNAIAWYQESIQICRQILSPEPEIQAELSWALWGLARERAGLGDIKDFDILFEESIHIARQLPPDLVWYRGWALANAGAYYLQFKNNGALAYQYTLESLQPLHQSGDHWSVTNIWTLGYLAVEKHDYELARSYFDEVMDKFTEAGDRVGIANAHESLGGLNRQMGKIDKMIFHYQEYLRIWDAMGSQVRETVGLLFLGIARTIQAENSCEEFSGILREEYFRKAAVLFGAADRLKGQILKLMKIQDEQEFLSTLKTLQHELGESNFRSAFARGQAMTIEQAVAYALESND